MIKFSNCSLKGSSLISSIFLDSLDSERIMLESLIFQKNSLESSFFINSADNFELNIEKNLFFDNFLNFSYFISAFKFSVFSGNFLTSCMNLSIISNNFINSSFIYQKSMAITLKNLQILSNLLISSSLMVIIAEISIIPHEIYIENLIIPENKGLFPLKASPNFLYFKGNFIIMMIYLTFVKNDCFIGAFFFDAMNSPSFYVSISSSNFSNNIASSIILLYNGITMKISYTFMSNNSISNEKIGNPCVFTDDSDHILLINRSDFTENSGNFESSCIFFKGKYLEIRNTNFKNHRTSIDKYQVFVVLIDSLITNFINVTFINGKGGSFSLNSNRENTYFQGENIVIYHNFGYFSSIDFNLLKYQIFIDSLKFIENSHYFTASVLKIYSPSGDANAHVVAIFNSLFLNNTAIDAANGLFEFRTIGNTFNVSDSLFVRNIVTGIRSHGSILYANGEITSFSSFYQCFFEGNRADSGSVFFILLSTFLCEKCEIFQNSVMGKNGDFHDFFIFFSCDFILVSIFLDAIFSIETYSKAFIKDSKIAENYGNILKISARSNLAVSRTEFLNSSLDYFKTFRVSLLAKLVISQCLFQNLSGKSNGFLLDSFNSLQNLVFEVFIDFSLIFQ